MTGLPWMTCHGHPAGCHCLGCAFLNTQLLREARASVALDRDDDDGTNTVGEADQ